MDPCIRAYSSPLPSSPWACAPAHSALRWVNVGKIGSYTAVYVCVWGGGGKRFLLAVFVMWTCSVDHWCHFLLCPPPPPPAPNLKMPGNAHTIQIGQQPQCRHASSFSNYTIIVTLVLALVLSCPEEGIPHGGSLPGSAIETQTFSRAVWQERH